MSKSEIEVLREAINAIADVCDNEYSTPEGGSSSNVTINRDTVRGIVQRARDAEYEGHSFTINLEVSDESMECLLDMAGYGIAYWASSAEIDDEARTYTVTENAEGEWEKHVIPYDKIIEAFWKAANPAADIKGWHRKHATRGYALSAVIDGLQAGNGDIEAGHIDADLADNIIQLAAFDEVQYG